MFFLRSKMKAIIGLLVVNYSPKNVPYQLSGPHSWGNNACFLQTRFYTSLLVIAFICSLSLTLSTWFVFSLYTFAHVHINAVFSQSSCIRDQH